LGERQRLAAVAAAGTTNGLLVMILLAVALPLLPPKIADPLWLLASTGGLQHQWLPGPAGGAAVGAAR
jgi:hypothetical protein